MTLTCIKTIRAIATALALVAFCSAAQAQSDSDVLLAKEAAQKGNWKALESLRTRLAGHPLEAYPTYWQLAGSIDRAPSADVQAYFARFPDRPLAESLLREWLKALAAAGQSYAFLA